MMRDARFPNRTVAGRLACPTRLAGTARLACAALLACTAFGCLSQTPPAERRYFRPPLPSAGGGDSGTSAPAGPAIPLRLERVTASSHLRQPMVMRRSDVEVGFDDVHQWADEPAALVEDALVRALFLESTFTRSESRDVATLRVRVTAFEEDLESSAAHVELWLSLQPEHGAGFSTRSVHGRAPIDTGAPEDVARAVGVALGQASAQVERWLRDLVAPR